MASSAGAPDADLFGLSEPDAANTLGGIKDDIDPEHPSVIMHLGAIAPAVRAAPPPPFQLTTSTARPPFSRLRVPQSSL